MANDAPYRVEISRTIYEIMRTGRGCVGFFYDLAEAWHVVDLLNAEHAAQENARRGECTAGIQAGG